MTDTQTPAASTPETNRPPTAASCSCGAWWTGLTRAHCAADGCHRTFSCDSAASQHRKGPYGGGRHCVDPTTVGLIAVEKPYGRLWQNAGPEGGYGALHADDTEQGAPGAAGGPR